MASDGGVAAPVPVQIALDYGADFIVGVNIAELLVDAAPHHLMGVAKRSSEIAYIHQAQLSAKGADVVINFDFKDIGSFTEEHTQYLYASGIAAGKKAVSEILAKLAAFDAARTKSRSGKKQ